MPSPTNPVSRAAVANPSSPPWNNCRRNIWSIFSPGRWQRRAARFAALPPIERRLLGQTVLLVAAIRIGLWVLPFKLMRKYAAQTLRRRCDSPAAQAIGRVSRLVPMGAKLIPGASCLTQALAAQVLLRSEGYAPALHFGVARGEGGGLRAHAWLECAGKTVVGGEVMGQYVRLVRREST